MHQPGPLLQQRYTTTPRGRIWLQRVPQLAQEYAELWQVELGRPLRSSSAYLAPARDAAGRALLLRLPRHAQDGRLEALAWSAWPEISPALYRRDGRRGALLIERIRPGSDPPEQGRLPQVARLLRVMQRESISRDRLIGLPRLASQVRERQAGLDSSWLPDELREAALARLAAGPRRLLHGRFAPGGVVLSREGWVLISPHPALGDPCYDAACWALADQHSGSVRRICAELARRADLDEERLRELAWVVAALELELAGEAYQPRLRRWLQQAGSDPLVRALAA